jgi:hypothetical protein
LAKTSIVIMHDSYTVLKISFMHIIVTRKGLCFVWSDLTPVPWVLFSYTQSTAVGQTKGSNTILLAKRMGLIFGFKDSQIQA